MGAVCAAPGKKLAEQIFIYIALVVGTDCSRYRYMQLSLVGQLKIRPAWL